MSIECHLLARDEIDILPYTIRHYQTFCDRIILHDAFSVDGTRELAKSLGVEVKNWRTAGIDDMAAKKLKADCVLRSQADWVIPVDADELIYFPQGAKETLAAYDAAGIAIPKPTGYELFSETFPTTTGQIYDEVKMGAEDSKWYAKSMIIRRTRVRTLEFSAGAHDTVATLTNGARHDSRTVKPSEPPVWMLHCKHLGPIDRIASRYARQQSRHSRTNVIRRFGNFEAPEKHSRDKRAMILAGLKQLFS